MLLQLQLVEAAGLLHDRTELLGPLAPAGLGGVLAAVALGDLHPRALGQLAHRLRKGDALDPHREAEGVAGLLATEAMEELVARADVEGRRLLGVEGAQANVVAALLDQPDVLADQRHHIDPLPDLGDRLLGDQSCPFRPDSPRDGPPNRWECRRALNPVKAHMWGEIL